MTDIILFNAIALLIILFVIIWFWLIKGKSTQAKNEQMTVHVKNSAYDPSRITTNQSQLTLNFIREDASPCAEYVLFEQLDIHEQLPLNKAHAIKLSQLKPGHYRFTCQMGMYQGELIVKPGG